MNSSRTALRLCTPFKPSLQASHRKLHLAPPFLVQDYFPRYLQQQPQTLERKREESIRHLKQCNICPRCKPSLFFANNRRCNVNRYERVGTCLIGIAFRSQSNTLGVDAIVNTAAPHFGEEACIQGVNGSGTIFFSGCNLRCVFCQVSSIMSVLIIELEYRT